MPATPLTGASARPHRLPRRTVVRVGSVKPGHAVLVTAEGSGAAAVAADQQRLIPHGSNRGLFSTACLEPATDWWITGADGRIGYIDTLVLANPGTTAANVTVTAWSSGGALEPPKLQSFTVDPLSAVDLPVANYAPDAANVTLHVHANSGRVTAEVRDIRVNGIRAAGLDWIPPTRPPARSLVVPGIPAGAGTGGCS